MKPEASAEASKQAEICASKQGGGWDDLYRVWNRVGDTVSC